MWTEPIAHLYRCETDVTDRFTGANGAILPILDRHIDLLDYSAVEFWPDPDMLEVGKKGRIDRPDRRQPKMSDAEYRAQFSLWSIMNAPLFISMDLRDIDDATKTILLNKDVIAINQDPLASPCRCIRAAGDEQIFIKLLTEGFAIAFLNRGSNPAHVRITTADLGSANATWTTRNLWTGETSQVTDAIIQADVEPHGVTMLRLHRTSQDPAKD